MLITAAALVTDVSKLSPFLIITKFRVTLTKCVGEYGCGWVWVWVISSWDVSPHQSAFYLSQPSVGIKGLDYLVKETQY